MCSVLFFFNLDKQGMNTTILEISMGRLNRYLPSTFLYVVCSSSSPLDASLGFAGQAFRMVSRCEGVIVPGTKSHLWKSSLLLIPPRHHRVISGLW